jgi:hypothetical protein
MVLVEFIVVISLLIAFPVSLYIFARKKITWDGIKEMCSRYRYHFYLLFGVLLLKSLTFLFEKPLEPFAIDLTPTIYGFEGNSVFWVQHFFNNQILTAFLAVIYIGGFLFIVSFSFAMFAYLNNYKMASKLALLNLVLFMFMIPFYLFVIVFVPSYPKMFFPDAIQSSTA